MPEETNLSIVTVPPTPSPKKHRARGRDGVCMRRGKFEISWIDATGRRCTRITAAATVQQARAFREAELLKAERARTLGIAPVSEDTFQVFTERYLRHQKARLTPAAYARTRGIVEGHLQPTFGSRRLAELRRADLERYITARTPEIKTETIIKEINTLKHLFRLAVDWELIPLSPAKAVKVPQRPAGRLRYLQPGELCALLAACPLWLLPIAGLLAFTGMRRGEVLGLRWLDVDFKGGRILLPQTKNGDGRIVPLNSLALQVLGSVVREDAAPTDRVFPLSKEVTPNAVSLGFHRVVCRLKIANFRLHDLRHTAASWLVMQGTDIYTVAKLLGHRDVKMTSRYAHLSPAHLTSAVQKLDAAFGPEMAKLPAWQKEVAKEN